ncbi:ABC transporter ATP-binding protein [Cupriavidus necator]
MPHIDIQGITKRYGDTTILDGLDLHIRDGEFLTLLGASGCGKSTLLRLLAGLESPDSGDIQRNRQSILAQTPSERDCAMVFQSYALYPHMTVGANICTPLLMRQLSFWQRLPLMRHISPAVRQARAQTKQSGQKVAQTLGIDHLWERKPAQLSGGQRQRVALARAMVRSPSLFLFDEPLSNLDANLRQSLRGEIRALHRQLGVTFVYVTHDQHEAMSMSDRVAVMKNGKILQLDSPTALFQRPASKEVACFVGSPRINVLSLQSLREDARQGLGSAAAAPVAPPATAVEIGIRPHQFLWQAACGAWPVRVRVRSVEYAGSEKIVAARTANQECIMVLADAMQPVQEGDALTLYISPTQTVFFDAQGRRVGA